MEVAEEPDSAVHCTLTVPAGQVLAKPLLCKVLFITFIISSVKHATWKIRERANHLYLKLLSFRKISLQVTLNSKIIRLVENDTGVIISQSKKPPLYLQHVVQRRLLWDRSSDYDVWSWAAMSKERGLHLL